MPKPTLPAMKKKLNIILLLLASGPVFSQQTFPVNGVNDDRERVYAFTHANIFTDYQTLSADATMIIRNGLVESVGKNTTIPAGAVIIDLQGKFIYPSFIDIYSDYGMPKISPEEDQRGPQVLSNNSGAYNWNQAVHPEVQAGELIDVMSEKAKELREIGFGTVASHQQDGIIRGTGTVVLLGDELSNEMIVK